MSRALLVLGSSLAWFLACGSPTGPRAGEPSEEAVAYLTEALDIMEAHSIRRLELDWVPLREEVLRAAGGAEKPSDTYEAIRYGLRLIGDGHSFFEPPRGQVGGATSVTAGPILGQRFSNVAYVTVPAISGSPLHPDTVAFADRLQATIARLDSANLCGWIVDLRENTGGNMWPMLAGIGPVLGEGDVGFFVDPEGARASWFYREGAAGIDGKAITTVSGASYQLLTPPPPVAVLTSRATTSSGEAVTIAFKGRPRTRSFGSPTHGLSTANAGFRLSDGATLFLTVSTMADRAGRLYGSAVDVDEDIENVNLAQPAGSAFEAARLWLEESCPG